jgi:hypothetical protein
VSEAAALEAALDALEAAFDDALQAALPNPVALTFSELPLDFQGKRDLVFALDLLNEGENEAALIAGLARITLRRAPESDVRHLAREAGYYLRTSIDPTWQFDDATPAFGPLLAYLSIVLAERTAEARARPAPAAPLRAGRHELLRRLLLGHVDEVEHHA